MSRAEQRAGQRAGIAAGGAAGETAALIFGLRETGLGDI